MKRISFFLALTLVIFSFGLLNAEQSVRINEVTNSYLGDLAINTSHDFIMRVINTPGGEEYYNYGVSWHVYSTDGAEWTTTSFDTLDIVGQAGSYFPGCPGCTPVKPAGNLGWAHNVVLPYIDFPGMFNSFIFQNGDGAGTFSAATGTGADSLAMVGMFNGTSAAAALFDGLDVIGMKVSIGPITAASVGKTICIDTLGADGPAGYEWTWPGFGSAADVIPAWLYEDGSPIPAGGACYDIVEIPDLPPAYDSGDLSLSGCHGDVLSESYVYTDPDGIYTPGDMIYTVTNGIGSFSGNTYSYTPTLGDVGASVTAQFEVCQPGGTICTAGSINITATNTAPTITNCPGAPLLAQSGTVMSYTFEYEDVCRAGDPVSFFISDQGGATPAGAVDGAGVLTFMADPLPQPAGLYDWEVGVTDGVDTSYCQFQVNIIHGAPYGVQIEKRHEVLQGHFERVNVFMTAQAEELGGFNFLIAYDASALTFQGADVDSSALYGPLPDCGWEYFTYRYGPFGNCGNGCPTGQVRVVGIAETNNGPNHPNCFEAPVTYTIFTLNFLVSNDRTLECQFVPIRFYWIECQDNTLSDKAGERLFISSTVKDFNYEYTGVTDLGEGLGFDWDLPSYLGAPSECATSDKVEVERAVDFINGGIDIVCADSIDARGDVNVNGLAYEIADAVMFTNYFIYGLSALHFDPITQYEASIAASDCNADGIVLSVADLVYLIRVIVGDAQPYPKMAVEANFVNAGGVLSVDGEMGALLAVYEGTVTPALLAENMEAKFNTRDNMTYVIVYSLKGETFNGDVLAADAPLKSVEMATADGAPVVSNLVPSDFALMQNYPNPFNPTTIVGYSLPAAGNYTLKIYNVAGQEVSAYSGYSEAGSFEIEVDLGGYSSGVYFYKFQSGDFSQTRKMVLLK